MINNFRIESFFERYTIQLPSNELISLLSNNNEYFIFIKNMYSVYQYANKNFTELMGVKHQKNIYNKTDYDLSGDQTKTKIYLQHDEEVLENELVLNVSEDISPQNNKCIKKRMVGKLYPVYLDTGKPKGILGIVKSKYLPFKLNIEMVLTSSTEEINNLLIKKVYSVSAYGNSFNLTRREIQCIIELIKGKHAGEIAEVLLLKQSTIEFYIANIKDKLGAFNKSSLMDTIFSEKILQQMVL